MRPISGFVVGHWRAGRLQQLLRFFEAAGAAALALHQPLEAALHLQQKRRKKQFFY
jgi:hypothetical protein